MPIIPRNTRNWFGLPEDQNSEEENSQQHEQLNKEPIDFEIHEETFETPRPETPPNMASNDTSGNQPRGVKINPPRVFSGKWNDLEEFIFDCHMYLVMNKDIYKEDNQKILFILSYMKEGSAADWK